MISIRKMRKEFEYLYIHNESASAKIALQGAHVFSYERKSERPVLWMSQASEYEYGKAIRGGVPICWPWFGQHIIDDTLPQHGFARTAMFELLSAKEINSKTTEIHLKLQSSEESFRFFKHHFELIVKITISEVLTIALTTTNRDDKDFELTQALHSYFEVSHISNIKIQGLDKKRYYDALSSEHFEQDGDITFTQELDRVYQKVDGVISLIDKERIINIENKGSASVVVWNPWIEKCSRMSAMEENSYETFVCIESANALDDFILLLPGESHTLKATIC